MAPVNIEVLVLFPFSPGPQGLNPSLDYDLQCFQLCINCALQQTHCNDASEVSVFQRLQTQEVCVFCKQART